MEIDESSGESIKQAVTTTHEEIKDAGYLPMTDANVSVEEEATACGDIDMEEILNEALMKKHPHTSGKDIKGEGKASQTCVSSKFTGPT